MYFIYKASPPAIVEHEGGTGSTDHNGPEEELRRLREQVAGLEVENRNLHQQLEVLQGKAKDDSDNDAPTAELTDDAVRKRLQRLCERKKNGPLRNVLVDCLHARNHGHILDSLTCIHPRSLQVPESIHQLWLKGGVDRNELMKQLRDVHLDKVAGYGDIGHSCFLLRRGPYTSLHAWQDRFVKNVEILIRSKEQSTYKVKARFATEQKMRDEMKYSECLGHLLSLWCCCAMVACAMF